VGTKQLLRDGAVTNQKLANGAINGAKVARKSLTGGQIDAATLGTVPNATHASNASNAAALQGRPASSFLASSSVSRIDSAPTNCSGHRGSTQCFPHVLHTDGFDLQVQCYQDIGQIGNPPAFELVAALPTNGEVHWGYIHAGSTPVNGGAAGSGSVRVVDLSQTETGTGTIVLRSPGRTIALDFDASVFPVSAHNGEVASWEFHAVVTKR
jgi:hypothetical protein